MKKLSFITLVLAAVSILQGCEKPAVEEKQVVQPSVSMLLLWLKPLRSLLFLLWLQRQTSRACLFEFRVR